MAYNRMVAGKIQLRLALSMRLGSTLEIGNNGFEQRIPVFYDNSGIEALALNNGISRTNGETISRSMLFEPGKEQSIAIGLTPVTIVTHWKVSQPPIGVSFSKEIR